MAFSSYKSIADVQEKFNIKHVERSFIIANPTTPSPEFLQDLAFVQQNIDIATSEAARCEAIIFPILKEVYKRHYQHFSLWIKKHISFDSDLQGEPDYLLATKSELGKKVLAKPLLAVVEAKKNDFEHGWGQCLVELVALQKINDVPNFTYYGMVSDGNLWQFGKLTDSLFVQDTSSLTLDNLERLFGALTFVFEAIQTKV
ncbi:MAG: hypothetical protein AAF639_08525 [Chloroflexota bacterium]